MTTSHPIGPRVMWTPYLAYVPYLVLVVLHATLGWTMRHPIIFADELGYLGQARFLSGSGLMPDMGTTTYYHFGYSLFLIPACLMFEDPSAVYRAAIFTNAVLISVLYFALLAFLRSTLRQPTRLAVPIAFVVCLYPAFMLQSNLAWAENALIPAYAFVIVSLSAAVRRPSWARMLGLGLLAGFLYTIHPRSLPLLPLTAVTLCALAAYREIPWRGVLFGLAGLAIVYVATDLAADWLRGVGWSPRRQAVTVGSYLARRASPDRLVPATLAAAGQLLYLMQATCGSVLVPVLWVAHRLRSGSVRRLVTNEDRQAVITVGFIILCSLVLLAVSALATSGSQRADGVVYGRYIEIALPHHLVFAFVVLIAAGGHIATWRLGGAVAAVLGLLTAVVLLGRGSALDAPFVAPNILGIYPLVQAFGKIDPFRISVVSAAAALIVFAAFRRRSAFGLAAAGAWFLAGSLYAYQYFSTAQQPAVSVDDIPSRIRALGVQAVGYDVRLFARSPRPFYSMQYLLPHTRVQQFNMERGDSPAAPVVIGTTRWPEAEALRARFVTAQRGADLALWLLPPAKRYYAASASYLGLALGWRRYPGVWESGFYGQERNRSGPFRWTDGDARLVVPVNTFPTHLVTDLRPASPDLGVRIIVNGIRIHDGTYAAGRRTFDLSGCPVSDWVTVELKSDTRLPRADARRIGIALREVRLEHR